VSDSVLTVSLEDGVGVVRIDRPPVNAMSFAAYVEIAEALGQVSREGARCAVLATAGRHFIAGHDRNELAGGASAAERRHLFQQARSSYAAIGEIDIPVIAAIKGACLGSGVVIASQCDFRLADESAHFGFPELDLGVLGGARHMMEIAPAGLTRMLFYTGRKIGAERLLQAGAVDEVFAADRFEEEVAAVAAEIAARPLKLLRKAKEVLLVGPKLPLDRGYWLEQQETLALLEAAEGDR
jgi:enoyl-CoA hydratase